MLKPILTSKSIRESLNGQFSHLYVNQLFSVDAKIYRYSNFVFVLPMQIHMKENLSKVGCFSKTAEVFITAPDSPFGPKITKVRHSFEFL